MLDRDLVLAKLASIDLCLKRIADVTDGDPQTLDEQNVEDVFVLLRAILTGRLSELRQFAKYVLQQMPA